MAREGFENKRIRTLIWVIRQLSRRPMTLKEINERWVDNADLSAGCEYERRTFSNHLRSIADLFGIDIVCDRRNAFRYHIENAEVSPVIRHIIDNFEQNIALGNSIKMEDRILVDAAPQGHEHLEKILEAMEKSRNITITFQMFGDDEPFDVTGAPYCVKLYQQRWYVVICEEDGYLDSYSLDRVTHLRMEKTKYTMDPNFKADEYFRYSFGVRVSHEYPPTLITLKVDARQRDYFRTLPLHPSQQETETQPDYSIFTIEVIPTIELMMKILSYGFLVEVLEPQFYRDAVMKEVKALYHKYF